MRWNHDFCADRAPLQIGVTGFSDRNSETTLADIMRRFDEPVTNSCRNKYLNSALVLEIDASDEPVDRFDEHDRIPFILERRLCDQREILNQSDHAYNGSRIDIAAERLVVEADITSGN